MKLLVNKLTFKLTDVKFLKKTVLILKNKYYLQKTYNSSKRITNKR